jgi:hypothetical protein
MRRPQVFSEKPINTGHSGIALYYRKLKVRRSSDAGKNVTLFASNSLKQKDLRNGLKGNGGNSKKERTIFALFATKCAERLGSFHIFLRTCRQLAVGACT